ncbi:Predicted Zn-dependent peptidase [Sporobacter termitidis DSM 10068]|uniref:Predicted Zn-dependent peptidase n=1 Tax=Sporobacter termitidis DSM 10068 TaxID=1123282 RepID=A0A1M5TDW1_9FIRM|nr:insulinase family protein [Sporobacter termitidis]SHH48909.1 Predicted Zn-dependent peptidase [Sporobacter termitidis DSM 10068]
MQEVIRKQIMPDTNLTCVKTDKFKTCCLSVNLITKLDKDTAAKNALLPRVLLRGTATHPDMEQVNSYLDELYGARILPMVRKKGEKHCIGFLADFIDDDFVPKGENILEKTAALLGEMLLAPATHGGLLISDYVESEKKNLIDDIRAGINDKRSYSLDRLFELMCDHEPFGINRLGDEKNAETITAASLTKHYKSIIAASRIEIFYCGAHEPARVEAALLGSLEALPRAGRAEDIATDVRLEATAKEPRTFTDKLDVNQGKLTVGFRLGKTMLSPNYAALMVFNAIYGGSVTSKLFLNVREKLSLCYYASSIVEKHKGIMAVASGVEFAKFDEALREILAQLDAIRRGEISDWELVSAKRAVITSIKSTMDRPTGLEELFFDQSIASIKYTPDELAGLCDAVTAKEVADIASGIETDMIYYLTGTNSSAGTGSPAVAAGAGNGGEKA